VIEAFPAPRKKKSPSAVAERVTGWPEVAVEGKAAQVKLAETEGAEGGVASAVTVPPGEVKVAWMNSLKSVTEIGVKGVRVVMAA
jgi:hypothetical protein